MYYKEYYIHTYDVDKFKRLKVSALLNYFQDVMVHHADSFGAGTDYYQSIGLLWVLIDYEIDIIDLPIGKKTVTCGTTPYALNKFFAFRKWELLNSDGELLASAKGKFVLIDVNTKEIVEPKGEVVTKFLKLIEEAPNTPFSKNRKLNSEILYKSKDTVKSSYIDINNHMNNVYYMISAYDNIPHNLLDEYSIKNIRITYKKESLIGNSLNIEGRRNDNILSYEIINGEALLSRVRFILKKYE